VTVASRGEVAAAIRVGAQAESTWSRCSMPQRVGAVPRLRDRFENGDRIAKIFPFFSNASWMRMLGRSSGHRGPPRETSKWTDVCFQALPFQLRIRLMFEM
jgi:hypothetical protein